jgi:HlyD family secretion protein
MINKDTDNLKRRNITGRLILVFFGFMLFLTFFSNTINNFSLPRATYEQPSSGSLLKEVAGEGTVEAREIISIYTQSSRVVLELKVKAGEQVTAGQELMLLDTAELEQQLKEEEIRYEKLKLVLEKLGEESIQGGNKTYSNNVDSAREKVQEREQAWENAKALQEAGSESLENVRKAEKDLAAAKKEYELKQGELQNKKKSEGRDIQNAQYDLELQKIKVDKIRVELSTGSRITAPRDGVITELNFSEGSKTNNTKPLAVLADRSGGFEFKAAVDADAAQYLALEDNVEVSIKALGGKRMIGKLVKIEDTPGQKGDKKDIYVELAGDGLTGGETGEIQISKKTRAYPALVANSAVGQDGSGKFVYVIKERKGALGNEYYAQKAYISTADSDNYKTALLNGLDLRDRVIVKSDRAVSDGGRVLLVR